MNVVKIGSYLVEVKKSASYQYQQQLAQATSSQPASAVIFHPAFHQPTNERCLFQFVEKSNQKEVAALTREVKVQMLAADNKSLDILRLREVLQDGPINNPNNPNNPNNQNEPNPSKNHPPSASGKRTLSNNQGVPGSARSRKRSWDSMESKDDDGLGGGGDGFYGDDDDAYGNGGKPREAPVSPPPPRYYLAFEGFQEDQVKDLLQHIKEQGKLSEKHAKHLFRSLLQTVNSLHSMGVIHGDLKLPNLLVYEEKKGEPSCLPGGTASAFGANPNNLKLKVKDFRYSTIVSKVAPQNNQPQQEQHNSMIDGIGMITSHKGSPAYLAPEITSLSQNYCGKKADVYALGVILFTMLVGGYPITAPSLPTLLDLIRKGAYTIPSFVSKEAANLLNLLLQKDPKLRISTQEALQHPWFVTGVSKSNNTPARSSPNPEEEEEEEQVVPGGESPTTARNSCAKEVLKGRKIVLAGKRTNGGSRASVY